MAKKKNSQFLPGLLEDIMSLLTPEEQEIAFELFNDGANQVDEELSHIYYHHQCPDYRLIAQPIASYLMPLWTMDDMSSLSPAEIYSSCAVIPQETLERDLRNFIFNIFVVYRKMPEKCYSYRMWYALGIMEHFRMEHCLDIVLEVLRQDLDFYDFYFGYLYETMLSAITYQLGQNQLDVLMDFMKEPGLLPMSKYRVIEAVAHIVITHPDRREEVMDWFGNLLSYYFDVLKEQKNDICSTLLLDHVTACMMDIRGVETLPILQKIYRTYHIKPYGIPSINELKKKMPYAEMHGLEMERVEDYLVEVFEVATDEEEDEEIYDDPLYMEDQPAKKFRIKIELKDSEPLVWRILEVPSNICLERFSEVVEVAMGWDGYHLHRFIKGNTYYLPPKDRADDCFFEGVPKQFDSGMLSLGELLCRKGSKIKYEYDFGDSWIHEIILESCQSYKKEEIPVIALLDGENACPPEDCNGIWGYRKMLKALEKPRSKAAREYKEWLGYNFDPTEFDLDETRGLLAEIVD